MQGMAARRLWQYQGRPGAARRDASPLVGHSFRDTERGSPWFSETAQQEPMWSNEHLNLVCIYGRQQIAAVTMERADLHLVLQVCL